MKFNKSRQLLLVSAASLLVAGLLTACGSLTVDFVYVTSAKAAGSNNYGEVDVFEINSESGFMRQIPTSPFPSGGRNPVAEAVSPDNTNLYVVNQDDNTIVQFLIGNDGKLYPQNTVNTPGVFPLSVAVGGSYLYVLDTYQPLANCSSAAACSGSMAVFPILPASGSGSTAVPAGNLKPNSPINSCTGLDYVPFVLGGSLSSDVILPTGLSVLANASGGGSNLYVSAYDTTANKGYVFGFSIGTMSCPNNVTIPTLTAVPGSPWIAGTHPSAITSVGGLNVYITDSAQGIVLGYSAASTGLLTPLTSGTNGTNAFQTGGLPSALVADTTGKYLYVTSAQDGNIVAYSISGGALTQLGTFATGLQPMAIGIDPGMHQFLFTANYLGNSVSGFELSPADGTLINSQNTPYTANAQPTAVAAIPHNGNKQ